MCVCVFYFFCTVLMLRLFVYLLHCNFDARIKAELNYPFVVPIGRSVGGDKIEVEENVVCFKFALYLINTTDWQC